MGCLLSNGTARLCRMTSAQRHSLLTTHDNRPALEDVMLCVPTVTSAT